MGPQQAGEVVDGAQLRCRKPGLASLGWVRERLVAFLKSIPVEILACHGR
jgi:hypothetical protein